MIEQDVIMRLFMAIGLVALGWAAYHAANRLILLRARSNRPALPVQPAAFPAVVYFTTPECVACKTTQRPALQRLVDQMGGTLQVIEINAQERPDLASQWGVLSVPTTFIIDSNGNPVHVNHGVTRAEKLFEQIASLR